MHQSHPNTPLRLVSETVVRTIRMSPPLTNGYHSATSKGATTRCQVPLFRYTAITVPVESRHCATRQPHSCHCTISRGTVFTVPGSACLRDGIIIHCTVLVGTRLQCYAYYIKHIFFTETQAVLSKCLLRKNIIF